MIIPLMKNSIEYGCPCLEIFSFNIFGRNLKCRHFVSRYYEHKEKDSQVMELYIFSCYNISNKEQTNFVDVT